MHQNTFRFKHQFSDMYVQLKAINRGKKFAGTIIAAYASITSAHGLNKEQKRGQPSTN